MVSVSVLKHGCVPTAFLLSLGPGANTNEQYYRDMLFLMQELLSAISSIAGDVFVFQQYISIST